MRGPSQAWVGLVALSCIVGCSPSPSRRESPAAAVRSAAGVLAGLSSLGPFVGHLGQGGELQAAADGLRLSRLPRTASLAITLPADARGALRLERPDVPGFWLEVRALDLRPAPAQVIDAAAVYRDAAKDTDLVMVSEPDRAEEIRVLRAPPARVQIRWRLSRGATASTVRIAADRVEVLDKEGRARIAAAPMFAIDGRGVRRGVHVRLADDATTLVAELDATDLAAPISVDPLWTAVSSVLSTGHANGAVAKLPDGTIGFIGGSLSGNSISTVESYDATTAAFSTRPSMSAARQAFAYGTLNSGEVLVAGGFPGNLSAAEFFDATGKWVARAPMNQQRAYFSGVVYPTSAAWESNRFLVIGGATDGKLCEAYNPPTNTWGYVAAMSYARTNHTSTLLADGRVLVVGGGSGASISNAEVFDVKTNTWKVTPALNRPRARGHTAHLLASGKVVVLGGLDGSSVPVQEAETYDPATDTWSLGPASGVARADASVLLLSSGEMLVAGGTVGGAATNTSQLFAPASATWRSAGTMAYPRFGALAYPLSAGKVLLAGGNNDTSTSTTAEVWTPPGLNGSSCGTGIECASGFCVGGICCASSSCPSGSSCGTAVKGVCMKINGTSCAGPSECGSGACADGVCCDRACTAACETCSATATKGTCTAVDGAPDPRGLCAAGPCANGCVAGVCAFKPTTTTCGPATSCTGNTLTPQGKCSGTDATCVAGAAAACPDGFLCEDATKCLRSCAGASDCVSNNCDLLSGKCLAPVVDSGVLDTGTPDTGAPDTGAPDTGVGDSTAAVDSAAADTALAETSADTSPAEDATPIDAAAPRWDDKPIVSGEFTTCVKGADCKSGFCVDGVCCDTACTDRCNHCALPGSVGTCRLEPIGVDLRSECGPALQCLGTCDGKGQCIGAGPGTLCARNRCIGASSGVGPAYCVAAGASCPTGDSAPFDCLPYVCEPVFGACRRDCVSTADCAGGFVCDLAQRTCVAPSDGGDEGGCAMGASSSRTGSALVGLMVALGLGRRRRRA